MRSAIAYRRRLTIPPELEDERGPQPVTTVDAALLLGRCSPMERTLLKLRYLAGWTPRAQ